MFEVDPEGVISSWGSDGVADLAPGCEREEAAPSVGDEAASTFGTVALIRMTMP